MSAIVPPGGRITMGRAVTLGACGGAISTGPPEGECGPIVRIEGPAPGARGATITTPGVSAFAGGVGATIGLTGSSGAAGATAAGGAWSSEICLGVETPSFEGAGATAGPGTGTPPFGAAC